MACLSLLLYIAATSSAGGRTLLQQVRLGQHDAQCLAAPDATAVAAAKASANPPATTFCPWSAHQSVFAGRNRMVNFGRNESICADAIL